MPKLSLLFQAAAALVAFAAPAFAADLPSGGMTADDVAAWLRRDGYPAVVTPDVSAPSENVVATTTDGVDIQILLYGCVGDAEARRCGSLQYVTGWTARPGLTIQKANDWNAAHRYIRAYITPAGALYGEYDLDVSPGGTSALLDASLHDWLSAIRDFRQFFAAPD